MRNVPRTILSVLLAVFFVFGSLPVSGLLGASVSASPLAVQANAASADFVVAVTPVAAVPAGYIGVYTAQQLADIRNNMAANYILMSDIDLSAWGNWTPLRSQYGGGFEGVFDGNGHTISNMTINSSDATTTIGLFSHSYKETAVIKNLGMENAKITAVNNNTSIFSVDGGAIAGIFDGTISNCYVSGTVSVSTGSVGVACYVGGITGSVGQTISNCNNMASVKVTANTGSIYAGGIYGRDRYGTTSTTGCRNSGTITATGSGYLDVGGVCGYTSGSLTKCSNQGAVSASGTSTSHSTIVGGVAGGAGNNMLECSNTGAVLAGASIVYAGGVAGSAQTITKSYNKGSVSTSSANKDADVTIGGVAGSADGSVTGSYNTGTVKVPSSSKTYGGGLLGYHSYSSTPTSLSSCYNSGTVSIVSSRGYIAGVVGYPSPSITKCYNTGSVSLSGITEYSQIAGITGSALSSEKTISSCYNLGNVTATSTSATNPSIYVAGIMPEGYNGISNCMNAGAITASIPSASSKNTYCGGIAAQSYGTTFSMTNCYNVGTIIAPQNAGALAGYLPIYSTAPVKNCYYYNVLSPAVGNGGGTLTNVKALSASALKTQASFVGFDFSNVWKMGTSGYPILKALTEPVITLPKVYSVRYNANGGTGTMASSTHVYNVGKKLTANAFKKTGYLFAGWATSATGSVVYANGATVKNLSSTNGAVVNLYAKWKANPDVVAPTSVKMNVASCTLGVGATKTLSVTVTPSNALKTCTWSSATPTVATVDSSGKVTAKKVGTAVITAKTFNGKTTTCKVTVVPAPTSVKMNVASCTLGVGATKTLSVTVAPSNALKTCTWSSATPTVATVDSSGKITAKKVGTAVITAKTFNGKNTTCKVTVVPAPTSVNIVLSSITLGVKESHKLSVKTAPSNASTARTFTSSDKKIVTVDSSGKITAIKAGTAKITVKTYNKKSDTITVTVKAAPTSVKLNITSKTLSKGGKATLSSSVNSGAASYLRSYSSNKTSVATVDSKGVVTAKAKGTAVVTVKTYNGFSAKCTITVK